MPDTSIGALIAQTLVASAGGAFLANFVAELIKSYTRRNQWIEVQRDEDLSLLTTTILDVQDLAVEYWTQSAQTLGDRDKLLSAKIVARQHHCLELIAHLFTAEAKWDCDVQFTRFMEAVGGGDFGEPDRSAEPNRLTAIYQNGLAMSHLAKKCRRKLKRPFLA